MVHLNNKGLISGYFWSSVQKYSVLFIQLVSNIILARILLPRDFGYVGIIAVIVNIMQAFVEGGFGSAIVQKKALSDSDISTVFLSNLFFSIVLYAVLFLSSNAIAQYYNLIELGIYFRVEGIILIINAICIVQMNLLIREMRFKSFFVANFVSVLSSVIISVWCALRGMGVWSLIIRDLSKEIILMIILLCLSTWKPKTISFSTSNFISIFKYCFPILLASLTRRLYDSVQTLVIGRKYSPDCLGYYTQAKKMEEVPISGYSEATSQVLFSSLSRRYESDKNNGNLFLRKNIRLLNFFIVPIVAVLELCSSSIFHLLFGEKWNDSIPMFQILCLAGITIPAVKASCEALKAIGRSDLFFIVQLVQRVVGFIVILLAAHWSLDFILWALVLNSIIFFLSNMFLNKKFFSYSYVSQIVDIAVYVFVGFVVYLIIYYFSSRYLYPNAWLMLLIVPVLYFLFYFFLSYMLRLQSIDDIKTAFKIRIHEKNN